MKTTRCGLYLRVSTDRQALLEDGSLETQESLLRRYAAGRCTDRERWIVTDVYRGEGESGKDTNRPEFRRLLADAQAGRLDVILVTKLDRFSRSIPDYYGVMQTLTKCKVRLIPIDGNYDDSSADGRGFTGMRMVFAQMERERTAERTREKMQWRAEQGLDNGGQVLGYDLDPEKRGVRHVNPAEAKIVRLAYTKYLELGSLREVARWLNRNGYRTKSYRSRRGIEHPGRRFERSSVGFLLRNPCYIGKRRHNSKVLDARHPAIIDLDTWNRVQQELSQKTVQKGKPAHRGSKDHVFLLERLVFCGACSALMRPHYTSPRGQRRFYYRCPRNYDGNHDCPGRAVTAELLERVIVERVRRIARNDDTFHAAVQEAMSTDCGRVVNLTSEKTDLAGRLREIDKQIENLFDFARMAKGSIALAEELERLERQKVSLQADITRVEGLIEAETTRVFNADLAKDSCAFFDTVFDLLAEGEKRDLILTFVSSITYTDEQIKIELFTDPIPREKLGAAAVEQTCSSSRPEWLPFVDHFRTTCFAPGPETRVIFEELRRLSLAG